MRMGRKRESQRGNSQSIIGLLRVIWLTPWVDVSEEWVWRGSGGFAFVLRQHSRGQREHFFRLEWAGKEADVFSGIVVVFVAGIAEDEDREEGHAGVQFGDECRAADAGEMVL